MSLIVERMPEGGFVVVDAEFRSNPGRFSPPLFASTTINEALEYVREKLAAPATGAQIGGTGPAAKVGGK